MSYFSKYEIVCQKIKIFLYFISSYYFLIANGLKWYRIDIGHSITDTLWFRDYDFLFVFYLSEKARVYWFHLSESLHLFGVSCFNKHLMTRCISDWYTVSKYVLLTNLKITWIVKFIFCNSNLISNYNNNIVDWLIINLFLFV